MATLTEQRLHQAWASPRDLSARLASVDHKDIGKRYLVTSFVFFALAGVQALLMRTQLAVPLASVIGPEAYNQLFTMHGTAMIFLFSMPVLNGGFGNYFVPLMIGSRDMAFPRLNAFSYWVFLAGGMFMYSSFLGAAAPDGGWFNYPPLVIREYSPGLNIDFYALGIVFLGFSTTAGAINFIVTIFKLRAPGMSISRLPLFCWAILATAFAQVFALPPLTVANILLELERKFGFVFYDARGGGDPVLWQHLFWIFGHPDVYIILLPAVGIVSTIIPVFSGRPLVGYLWVAMAAITTAIISFGVWVHHMFAVGLPNVSMAFFAAASLLVTLPSGIQIFAWLATMLRGVVRLSVPMLYVIGFLITFVLGGFTGVMFAAVPFDQQITDSYFVVAHFHYVLIGGAVFPVFGALHYWLPKITGRMFHASVAKLEFWLVFTGFHMTFFPMHLMGLQGMPRRIYTYQPGLGWDGYNLLSTVGAFVLAAGLLLMGANFLWSLRRGEPAGNDPWRANTLEWVTTSPPPEYNYPAFPIVTSRDPLWDPDDRRRIVANEGPTLEDVPHGVLGTSVLGGEPEQVYTMPGPSHVPILLVTCMAVLFFALLFDAYLLAALAGAACGWVVLRWLTPGEEHH